MQKENEEKRKKRGGGRIITSIQVFSLHVNIILALQYTPKKKKKREMKKKDDDDEMEKQRKKKKRGREEEKKKQQRHGQDSNLRGWNPVAFEATALTARPPCH